MSTKVDTHTTKVNQMSINIHLRPKWHFTVVLVDFQKTYFCLKEITYFILKES